MTPSSASLHPVESLRFLRMTDVEVKVGLKKRTIQNMVKANKFPAPVCLLERSLGFIESEVNAWMLARIALREGEAPANA